MITAFDVKTDNSHFAQDCYGAALNEGLLIRPIGSTVYFMPPYCISDAEIAQMVQVTNKAIKKSI